MVIAEAEKRQVPDSCCAKGDLHLCTGIKSIKGPPLFFNSHLEDYSIVNPYLYTAVGFVLIYPCAIYVYKIYDYI